MNGKILLLTQEYSGYANPLTVTCKTALSTARRLANTDVVYNKGSMALSRKDHTTIFASIYLKPDACIHWSLINTPYHEVHLILPSASKEAANTIKKNLYCIKSLQLLCEDGRALTKVFCATLKHMRFSELGLHVCSEATTKLLFYYMPQLRTLSVRDGIGETNRARFPNITHLEVNCNTKIDWIVQAFPNLEHLTLWGRCISYGSVLAPSRTVYAQSRITSLRLQAAYGIFLFPSFPSVKTLHLGHSPCMEDGQSFTKFIDGFPGLERLIVYKDHPPYPIRPGVIVEHV
jgi:hypothetical protein